MQPRIPCSMLCLKLMYTNMHAHCHNHVPSALIDVNILQSMHMHPQWFCRHHMYLRVYIHDWDDFQLGELKCEFMNMQALLLPNVKTCVMHVYNIKWTVWLTLMTSVSYLGIMIKFSNIRSESRIAHTCFKLSKISQM